MMSLDNGGVLCTQSTTLDCSKAQWWFTCDIVQSFCHMYLLHNIHTSSHNDGRAGEHGNEVNIAL